MESKRGNTQIRLKHDLNQQQDLDLGQKLNTTNSETEICKGYGADGFQVENKYSGGLWDEGENTQTKRIDVNLTVYLKLRYKIMGTWVPDLPSGSG